MCRSPIERSCHHVLANSETNKEEGDGGRANTHSKITTHEKVLFVKQVLLIFSCLLFALRGGFETIRGEKKT
jgi:hypothetical protein